MNSTHLTKLDTISRLPSAMNDGHTAHLIPTPERPLTLGPSILPPQSRTAKPDSQSQQFR